MNIKIVEIQPKRCIALASQLPTDILVLRGDATDEDLLASENIEDVDLFLALTQDDENNIMSSLLAKRMGAKRVLALINRRSYADLMHGTQIDIALAPAQAMLGELLAYVRRGDVQAVHSLRRGQSEALEIVTRGDKSSSGVVGRKVEDVRWPRDVQVGLIVRGMSKVENNADRGDAQKISGDAEQEQPRILLPEPDTVIESGDRIILFLPSKRQLREVEKLFRVSATFF
jgi:trk system potassium uptake protein TrkA